MVAKGFSWGATVGRTFRGLFPFEDSELLYKPVWNSNNFTTKTLIPEVLLQGPVYLVVD